MTIFVIVKSYIKCKFGHATNNSKGQEEKRKISKLGSNKCVGVGSKDSQNDAIAEKLKRKSKDIDERKIR